MDDRAEIEQVVRDFFAPDISVRTENATGPLADLMRISAGVLADETEREDSYRITTLTVERVGPADAEVALDGIATSTGHHPQLGPTRDRWHVGGPVRLERESGQWKVVDYVLNGRPRSASIILGPAGTQEADGLFVLVAAADLQADGTWIFLSVVNRRDTDVVWGDAAFGSPRRRGWRLAPLSVSAHRVPQGGPHLIGLRGPAVPVDTRQIRLILAEHPRKATFDLVVQLDVSQTEAQDVQRAPEALPWRMRIATTPLRFVPFLLLFGAVVIFAGWGSAGWSLIFAGAVFLLTALWRSIRMRRLGLRVELAVGTVLILVGVGLVAKTGAQLFGCGEPRSAAPDAADAFVHALLVAGPRVAESHLIPNADPLRGILPRLPRVPARTAERTLATRRALTKTECNPFPMFAPVPESDDPCFRYELPDATWSETIVVHTSCETGEWKVSGFGPS